MIPVCVPATLLIAVVGRSRGKALTDVTRKAGAMGGTIMLGRAVGGNNFMRMLGLADVRQDIILTLLGPEKENVISAVKAAANQYSKKFQGMALTLEVSGMLARSLAPSQEQQCQEQEKRSRRMKSEHSLIAVIINHGYADEVMAAARRAGAVGGTIMIARGTGTEADVQFFGITLVPEKEVLLIVTQSDICDDILAAIKAVPILSESGAGIVFTLAVDEFINIGEPL